MPSLPTFYSMLAQAFPPQPMSPYQYCSLQYYPHSYEKPVIHLYLCDGLPPHECDGTQCGQDLEDEEQSGGPYRVCDDVLNQFDVVLFYHRYAQIFINYHFEKNFGQMFRIHRRLRCQILDCSVLFCSLNGTGSGLSSAYPTMNFFATYFSFFFCSIFKDLHYAINLRHSCSISPSNLITFSRSSIASSQALVNLRATPLRQIFLTFAESETRTWLAKVMTISYRLILRQHRARLEYAGRMTFLSISPISPFIIFCCTLCFKMYSNVITAFENSFVAAQQSLFDKCFLPKSQHSCAIFLCLWNSSSADSLFPLFNNFTSSPSESYPECSGYFCQILLIKNINVTIERELSLFGG